MKNVKTLFHLIFLVLPFVCNAQPKVYGDAGLSTIEHFSLGGGVAFGNHSAGVIYGSDFFLHQNKFVNLFGQYQLTVSRLRFSNFTPVAGLKGGHSVFSDRYYRWKVVSVIPYAGLQYQFTDQLEFYLQAGLAFSIEQSVTRLKFGEIGHYRERLPELKVGIRVKSSK